VNVTQKRHAVATCLAASTLPPLVIARGHRVGDIAELPLVISNGIESVQKTKQAVDILNKVGCEDELKRIADSRKVRSGKGKMRNRRYEMRRGPLVIYGEDNGIVRAFRNVPGVETMCVSRMNLLKLAPGGNFGRFVIWTEGAFKKLDEIYGSLTEPAPLKKGYTLPRAQMENADVARIINSTEVQSVLKPKLEAPKKFSVKKNPLKNASEMAKLNPGILHKRALRAKSHQKGTPEADLVQAKKKARMEAAKKHFKECKRGDDTFYKSLMSAFNAKAAESQKKAGEDEAGEEDEE
jgi:large subunit ribosomal protein L4e